MSQNQLVARWVENQLREEKYNRYLGGHPLVNKFKEGDKVRIKDEYDLELELELSDVKPETRRTFLRYAGLTTTVKRLFNHCCTLEIDFGHFGWGYSMIEHSRPEYLDKELFEI